MGSPHRVININRVINNFGIIYYHGHRGILIIVTPTLYLPHITAIKSYQSISELIAM